MSGVPTKAALRRMPQADQTALFEKLVSSASRPQLEAIAGLMKAIQARRRKRGAGSADR